MRRRFVVLLGLVLAASLSRITVSGPQSVTGLRLVFAQPLSEDVQLRQEAEQLLERANMVSLSPRLPSRERSDTFLAYDPSYGTREGSFTRVAIQGTGRRDETTFGDYHEVDIRSGGRLFYTTRTQPVAPPEVEDLMRITPIALVRLDHEDVVQAITDQEAGGRAVRCIRLDTVFGETAEHNELCVDTANGTLVSEKLGNQLIENIDFFPFAGELLPAKVRYSVDGVLKIEVTQSFTELTDPDPNVLQAPPDAKAMPRCASFRRAFGHFMPQPQPARGGGSTSDVLLRGLIGPDGKVHEAVVQSTERPELNPEALSLIERWQFSPALCNGDAIPTQASFILHFQGR